MRPVADGYRDGGRSTKFDRTKPMSVPSDSLEQAWRSPGFSAPLMSAVLGQAVELVITSGYVVAARGAAPPGVEHLVGMAAEGARRVDAADVLRTEGLGLRLAGRDGLAMPMPTTAATTRNAQEVVRVIQVAPLPKPPRSSCPKPCLQISREAIVWARLRKSKGHRCWPGRRPPRHSRSPPAATSASESPTVPPLPGIRPHKPLPSSAVKFKREPGLAPHGSTGAG